MFAASLSQFDRCCRKIRFFAYRYGLSIEMRRQLLERCVSMTANTTFLSLGEASAPADARPQGAADSRWSETPVWDVIPAN